jgi:hypothetical protein
MSDMPIAVDRVAPGPARIGIPCVDHRRQDGSGPAQLIGLLKVPTDSKDVLNCSSSVDQDKSHLEVDAILGNLSVLHDDLLFLDPRTLDILKCGDGASDALLDRILEALV